MTDPPPSQTAFPPLPEGFKIEYLADRDVDASMDRDLRELLSFCFSPEMFGHKRYNKEMPGHRWLVREKAKGNLVAHIAAHVKELKAPSGTFRSAGIAEVCVHPSCRGKKFVPIMLETVHQKLRDLGLDFSLLWGNGKVYRGSGYVPLEATVIWLDDEGQEQSRKRDDIHYCCLGTQPFPEGAINLQGPLF